MTIGTKSTKTIEKTLGPGEYSFEQADLHIKQSNNTGKFKRKSPEK